jgi:hypothetical protein
MSRIAATLGLIGLASLSACAVAPPTGPTVLAVPGKDKSFAQFQQDDGSCRNYAQDRIGPTSPSEAATQSGVGTAAIGTVLGAAAGAVIGGAAGNPGLGAAIGAGSGLALGAGAGASNAAVSGGSVQRAYDNAYIQCMSGNGEQVQTASAAPPGYAYPAPAYGYPYYPAPYPYPVVVGGPVIGFGYWHGGYYGRRY